MACDGMFAEMTISEEDIMSGFGPVKDNVGERRFELVVDGDMAFAEYHLSGDTMDFTHTLVPLAHRGRGVASALTRGALDSARDRGLKVIPTCSFIDRYIQAHPEYGDLLTERSRQRMQLDRE
jgi:uncharacterized protein